MSTETGLSAEGLDAYRREVSRITVERDVAKAAIERVRVLHRVDDTGSCVACSRDTAVASPCATLAALDAPETSTAVLKDSLNTERSAAISVPDRIDYDSNGELDDVVVKNCDAHLERMNDSRWYLGLYGNDGRKVQIDIASKTGRAEVTGIVKYSEGIAPETPGDAPEKPRHIGGRANAEDCPACDTRTMPYPWICPGEPKTPGDADG